MTTAVKPLTEIAAHWREARKLYTIYSALLERFALGLPPCRDLESPIDRNEPEAIQRIQDWFAQMDDRVHVHQLRQLLQTSRLGTEDNLRALVSHHLAKETKTEADRDKVDFLLVQYLSSCAPTGFYERNVEFEEIAQVLEPVLGEVGPHPPKWMEPLDQAIAALEHFRSLHDLLSEGTLEQMRKLKSSAGEMYFGPTALVAITRFNFLVRRTFVRLIAADLHAIRFSLHELEQLEVKTVDCARANLSSHESLENLREICQEWKKPFRAAYAAGHNFKELIEIRAAVEDALAHAPAKGSVRSEDKDETVHAGNGVPAPSIPSVEDSSSVKEFSFEGLPGSAPTASQAEPTAPASISLGPKTENKPGPKIELRAGPDAKIRVGSKVEAKPAVEAKPGPAPAVPVAPIKAVPTPIGAQPAPSSMPAPGVIAGAPILQATVEQITQQLISNHVKAGSVANISIGELKLMLSSWEVAAYLKGGDDTSDALQRAVATRALLLDHLDKRKHGGDVALLGPALKLAQVEAAKIQARISVVKESKDIDSAVNLAATSKRLLQLMEEAEKVSK